MIYFAIVLRKGGPFVGYAEQQAVNVARVDLYDPAVTWFQLECADGERIIIAKDLIASAAFGAPGVANAA